MSPRRDPGPRRSHEGVVHGLLRWIGEVAVYVVILLVVVVLLQVFLVQQFEVPTPSMEQTLQKHDRILVWKPGAPQRGEVVVFRDDLGWTSAEAPPTTWRKLLGWIRLMPAAGDRFLVKRLIGLPGDHVTCCDMLGRVNVNGVPLDESAYLYVQSVDRAQLRFDVIVPEGHFFVMGDHRDDSADSRLHMCDATGPTPDLAFPPLDAIQGRVVATVWPISHWRTHSIPDTFANLPPPVGTPPSIDVAQWGC